MERLDTYDQTEWRDVARKLGWTDERFEVEWAEFQEVKARRLLQ